MQGGPQLAMGKIEKRLGFLHVTAAQQQNRQLDVAVGLLQRPAHVLAENIIALHLAALRSETYRLVSVLKARDRRTDMRMRRFDIVEGGIALEGDHRGAEDILRGLSNQGAPPPPSPDPKLTGE